MDVQPQRVGKPRQQIRQNCIRRYAARSPYPIHPRYLTPEDIVGKMLGEDKSTSLEPMIFRQRLKVSFERQVLSLLNRIRREEES